jgi:hypothetical protein
VLRNISFPEGRHVGKKVMEKLPDVVARGVSVNFDQKTQLPIVTYVHDSAKDKPVIPATMKVPHFDAVILCTEKRGPAILFGGMD